MKSLALILTFGLISFVSTSQYISVNNDTLPDGDTVRLSINNLNPVILRNIDWNNIGVLEYPDSLFIIGQALGPSDTWNPDTIHITGANTIKYFFVGNQFFKNYLILTFDATASVSENVHSTISVFPNPVNDFVTVMNYELPIEIYDLKGQMRTIDNIIYSSSDEAKIDLSTFIPGLYILKSGTTLFKIVKQ